MLLTVSTSESFLRVWVGSSGSDSESERALFPFALISSSNVCCVGDSDGMGESIGVTDEAAFRRAPGCSEGRAAASRQTLGTEMWV